jgi:hypothetical protein
MKNKVRARLLSDLDHRAEETVRKLVSRLCRPMCGRAVPFRNDLIESGAAPHVRGVAPKWLGVSGRWGVATTAHRAAQPRTEFPHNGFENLVGQIMTF